MTRQFSSLVTHWRTATLALCAAVSACSVAPPAPPQPAPVPVAALPPPLAPPPAQTHEAPAPPAKISSASSARAYRLDAAGHLYELNAPRIYRGKMPPLLYAVGVLQVDVDPLGRVTNLSWMRAPRHAPEVMAEIERTVRSAAPFPAPARIGRVTYTETWLWHKSGQFQLDTLTEGQL